MSRTNKQKFLAALLGPFQALEDALQQMIIGWRIENAVGQQLTELGRLVGIEREGVTDDVEFRRYVRAQIITNKSDGLVEDLIAITKLIIFDDDAYYKVINHGTATVTVRIENVTLTVALAQTLMRFLRRAVSGGVRLVLEFSMFDPAEMFECESFVPGEGPGLGFGSTLDADVGGKLAFALV